MSSNSPELLRNLTISGMNESDVLLNHSSKVFDEKTMGKYTSDALVKAFREAIKNGTELTEAQKKEIASGMFTWARSLGATHFAHWFFPCRGGGGAVGGSLAGLKEDTFVDLQWGSDAAIKPFEEAFPYERLFCSETDGSSFPNGGQRATHTAAAFTSWDRSSPCFIHNGVMRIPACFVTHYGDSIDLKTPLLRSGDAVSREGMRLIKNMGDSVGEKAKAAQCLRSYVGWEQEFFVISAATFKDRPDLVNAGRTLFGALPPRNQQGDLNYFGPMPNAVKTLLAAVEGVMLSVGSPMAVRHNEVAPGQHEMCPIFTCSSASCDSNVLFMEVCAQEAQKRGLVVLFHEKPFAGINGSGKHNNWSIGTDTGINFFYPGKTDEERICYTTGVAALAYGLRAHNELVRVSVAHAGNDHRLGAQEAPPAIISLYPGVKFEAHIDAVINGADLLDYKAQRGKADPKCNAAEAIEANAEDRNRTAPFPFCGNRFEFRAVGSSQNCALPTTVINTVWASGCAHISELIEGGKSLRDAVGETFKSSRDVVFTGNGYSAEWPIEAAKRGLPNLNTTPLAIAQLATDANKKILSDMKVFSNQETEALSECMYENYITTLSTEVETMLQMVETGFIPAYARDLANYAGAPQLAGERPALYMSVKTESDSLAKLFSELPDGLAAEAAYLDTVIKPQMAALRAKVDASEKVMQASLYPYPTYKAMLYDHHF